MVSREPGIPPARPESTNARQSADAAKRASRIRTVLTAAITAAFALTGMAAYGATIVVNSLADPGAPRICTLRDAITAANTRTATNRCDAGNGNDTIRFIVTGKISITNVLPEVTDMRLTIDGPISPGITIDGGGTLQVMRIASGSTVNIDNLTISHGAAGFNSPPGGGGIFNAGKLTVNNSSFYENSEGFSGGGGIDNSGTLTVTNTTFSGNDTLSNGGAIDNEDTLAVTDSTFSNNNAAGPPGSGSGGGIFNEGSATIAKGTFSNNGARDAGGGIENNSGTMKVTNTTFSGDIAGNARGGGIFNAGTITVSNSTFANNGVDLNEGAGGIVNLGSASLNNTVLASSANENTGAPSANCSGTIIDAGYNISDDGSCGFTKTGSANNGDGVNPMLSSDGLTNNGGPTQTIALAPGSPAIDAIPLADCTDQSSPPMRIRTDQRGFPRPDFGEDVCDIGAFETQETFAGQPGKPNCHGQNVSALSNQYGNLDEAALALGLSGVQALQNAIRAFCGR